MNTLSLRALRFRRSILLGVLLALAGSSSIQAQDRVRTTASTGIFTLLPRQVVRLHLVDTGLSSAPSSTARIELRDERGTLLGFRFTTSLRSAPIHLVLRADNLLGSRSFLYVRAVAVVETGIDNLASGPVFSVEFQPEGPGSLAIATGTQCPMPNMGPPPPPHMPVLDCGGGCHVIHDLVAP